MSLHFEAVLLDGTEDVYCCDPEYYLGYYCIDNATNEIFILNDVEIWSENYTNINGTPYVSPVGMSLKTQKRYEPGEFSIFVGVRPAFIQVGDVRLPVDAMTMRIGRSVMESKTENPWWVEVYTKQGYVILEKDFPSFKKAVAFTDKLRKQLKKHAGKP